MKNCPGCDHKSDHAFCPVCGSRIDDNPFLGKGLYDLEARIDDVQHNHRWALASIREIDEEYKRKIESATSEKEAKEKELHLLYRARQYAKDNNIP